MNLLRRIFEDSFHTNIATLLAVEHLYNIYALAARADELYVLYPPTAVNLALPAAPATGGTAIAAATALQKNNISNLMQAGLVHGDSIVSQLVANSDALQVQVTIRAIISSLNSCKSSPL